VFLAVHGQEHLERFLVMNKRLFVSTLAVANILQVLESITHTHTYREKEREREREREREKLLPDTIIIYC
jgi:hypothetical protein